MTMELQAGGRPQRKFNSKLVGFLLCRLMTDNKVKVNFRI